MKRRDFLKSAAIVIPAAGFEGIALGQSGALPPLDGIHPVEAGQDRFGETHSLGFYRDTSGPALVSVTALLDAPIDLLRGKILMKNAEIDRQWEGEVKITAVPGELRQVFSNLLANSLDALNSGGHITIRVKEFRDVERPRIQITFVDDGRGIPREMQPKIFDPFFTTKGNHGTGLGL